MVTRKCGTCRFFQDAEIACSGWCTHPERGELHDLVLVRRAELACRNSWDQDLWEAAEAHREPVPSVPVKRPTPPRQAIPDNPTDRVTSIDIARPVVSGSSQRKHPIVAGGQDSRALVDPSPAADDDDASSGSTDAHKGVSALEPSFSRALRGPGAKRDRLHSVNNPERKPHVVSPPRQRPQQPPTPRFVGVADRGPGVVDYADDTTPLPTEEVNFALQAEAMQRKRESAERRVESRPAGAQLRAPAEPVIHVDGLNRVAGQMRESFSPAPTGGTIAVPKISPLDDTPWVAGMPRCCDTCREFHRDASGKSGYCRSPYAFSGRTMVQSDQLACRSSIGVWWLPSDDTWLEKADISHHTRPTPYLDAVLAELRPESR